MSDEIAADIGDILDKLHIPDMLAICIEIQHVGSRVTCDPPPQGDDDWLLLVSDWRVALVVAIRASYLVGGSVPSDQLEESKERLRFTSLKRDCDKTNLIITDDEEFFDRFMAATSVAKRLNLLEKDDRIALFQAVLYGNECSDRQKKPMAPIEFPPKPKSENGITLTQCGQPWPYADSIYAGTVVAESEEDAVSNLSQMRNVKNIPMSKDQVNWHSPYFERFEKTGENE